MTTRVIVKAHCDAETTVVRVSVTGYHHDHLEDGEEREYAVHDDRLLRVQELDRVRAGVPTPPATDDLGDRGEAKGADGAEAGSEDEGSTDDSPEADETGGEEEAAEKSEAEKPKPKRKAGAKKQGAKA